MVDVLSKTTSVAEDPGPWSAMIYGDAGAGKTVFACQSTKPLLADIEKSRRSLLNHPELIATPVVDCYKSLNKLKQLALDIKSDKEGDYKTVVVDTVTSLQNYDLNAQMKIIAKDDKRDPDLPSQAEFNKNNRRISRVIEDLLDACNSTGRNLIVLSHMKEEKDEDDKKITTLIRPSTSPALTEKLLPMVDAVFYLEYSADSKGQVTRTLRTVATRKIRGKNRFGNLPASIVDPHFSVIEKAAEEQRQVAMQLLAKQ